MDGIKKTNPVQGTNDDSIASKSVIFNFIVALSFHEKNCQSILCDMSHCFFCIMCQDLRLDLVIFLMSFCVRLLTSLHEEVLSSIEAII
jgi:hypothetical protein